MQPLPTTPSVPLAPVLPRVARGESGAVKECLERYGKLVHTIARRWAHDTAEVEDASQDVFVALWRKAAAYDPERSDEPAFVALVARRRLIDRLRAPSARHVPVMDADVEDDVPLDTWVDAKSALSALDACTEQQRGVVLRAVVQGLTHEEIARELAMPLGTVKSHYARGIERVKRRFSIGGARASSTAR